jgi:hypothetical protein
MPTAALLAVVSMLSSPHPLVGTWKIDFPAGMRIQNGEATPVRRTGTLTVEARGDSLIATLVPDPSDAPSRGPVRLAAKSVSGDVTFVTTSQVTINVNGSEQQGTSTATWILGVKDDKLSGTVDRKVEAPHAPAAGPQPVTGTRVQGS